MAAFNTQMTYMDQAKALLNHVDEFLDELEREQLFLPRESDYGQLSNEDKKRVSFQKDLIAKMLEARAVVVEVHKMTVEY